MARAQKEGTGIASISLNMLNDAVGKGHTGKQGQDIAFTLPNPTLSV